MDDFKEFARLIDALRPWLGHLVIVGGWAHRLHRFHELANPPNYQPLTTRDADVAFSPTDTLSGDLSEALRSANFHPEYFGEHTPPVTQYRLGEEGSGFYVEFLVPLRGSGVKRNGSPDATLTKAGVSAQKLRHLELLLTNPWTVRVGTAVGVPLASPADINIANPVAFIAQKLLIQKYRKKEKQPQDALYIHDALELFGRRLENLRVVWQGEIRPTLASKTARDVERLQQELFGEVTDVIRRAAQLRQDRTLRPEQIQAACSVGLGEIFAR